MTSTEQVYGDPAPLPLDVDFYWLSNEDLALTASLTAAANVHSVPLPMPSSWDQTRDALIVHKLEFHLLTNVPGGDLTLQRLQAWVSYLDRRFSPTFAGLISDQEDEALKAQLSSPISFGQWNNALTATAAVEGVPRGGPPNISGMWYPPVPLDLGSGPLYLQIVNQSSTATLATNAMVADDFDAFEALTIKVWFTIRRLTSAEQSARMTGQRFSRLDS